MDLYKETILGVILLELRDFVDVPWDDLLHRYKCTMNLLYYPWTV